MARPQQLSADGLDEALGSLAHWKLDGDKLFRSFRFDDFNQAFGFMTRAALVAESLDHHPEWSNVWNRVDVRLTTHDAGGITELDVQLAHAMDRIAAG